MDLQALFAQLGYFVEKSAGVWLTVWALRYKAGWDYKLSGPAKAVRWGIVCLGYVLAAEWTHPGVVRTVALLAGLSFLCWPNFAYWIASLFAKWPETKGHLISITNSDRGETIVYSFDCGGETFGGTTLRRRERDSELESYSPGQHLSISYDPLNPERSKVIF